MVTVEMESIPELVLPLMIEQIFLNVPTLGLLGRIEIKQAINNNTESSHIGHGAERIVQFFELEGVIYDGEIATDEEVVGVLVDDVETGCVELAAGGAREQGEG